jgi:alginate O-acetyltransferase complex protein AlgI
MLFNSYPFIWLFLPVALAGFFLAARFRHEAAAAWLALCSLFFYGYWDVHYVPLLLLSITVNYQIGKQISNHIEKQAAQRAKMWLIIGLVFDLGLLAHYKYTNFFLDNWVTLTGSTIDFPNIILPLGISFFTFTQIAYLADCHKGIVKERNPCALPVLFITYFPHLIAGPILHHKQMMPQFAHAKTYRISQENIAIGLTIFAIGMFKKVIVADSFPEYANPVFAVSKHTGALSFQDAWLGCLAYTLQLYFDFSAYSDMAIGLSRLFGIKMPLNFNSPYKSTSIIDFWNRWHITLSQFLRQYLYFALGGNRKGKAAALHQHDAHDAARWLVARRWLDFRHLGRAARPLSGDQPFVPRDFSAGAHRGQTHTHGCARNARLVFYHARSCRNHGNFSRRFHTRCHRDSASDGGYCRQ